MTLGLLRHLSRKGISVRGAKSGPDYIDPMYHLAASGRASVNLDAWAMDERLIRELAYFGDPAGDRPDEAGNGDLVIVEGAMGAIDGAGSEGLGSAADLAKALNIPVVMIVSTEKAGHSCILPVLGFQAARPDIHVAGFIANRVASDRHAEQISSAAAMHGLRLFGSLRRRSDLILPSRHLGLVPAAEHRGLEGFLDAAADAVESDLDVTAITESAWTLQSGNAMGQSSGVPPPGQRMSAARDEAFCFMYSHLLTDWRLSGAEISFFSPLADEPPRPDCDAVYLPGGYPELHAVRIAGAKQFARGMHSAARKGAVIYGECGGFMVLGQGLEDRDGNRHQMLGLLGHSSSFSDPRLHLGYRKLKAHDTAPFAGTFSGHEFHYASLNGECRDECLFSAKDADDHPLPGMGGIRGSVSGSFAHLICASASDR